MFCQNQVHSEIWSKVRASSRDFDHLPYFIGFRRVFPGNKVRATSSDFTWVRASSNDFNRLRIAYPSGFFWKPISIVLHLRKKLTKFDRVGQVPYFIGFLTSLKLANLTNLIRVGCLVGWDKSSKSHQKIVARKWTSKTRPFPTFTQWTAHGSPAVSKARQDDPNKIHSKLSKIKERHKIINT